MDKSMAQPHYYHSTRVRVARPEGCRVEQIYPLKEALLYRDRKFLSSLRHELAGQWSGFCTVTSDAQPLDLCFRLHFENASARGEGQDAAGSFTVEGCFLDTDLSLHLTKKYATHSVEYHGHYKGDRTFSGEWWQPGAKGFFELTKALEPEKGLLPAPAELADNDHSFIWSLETENNLVGDWVGHCTQDSSVYDLTLSLVFNKGSVSGHGSDMAGSFTWSGLFDAREMHISLIKLYPTHRVYFNGFYQANKTFEGDWVIDDHAHGVFRVTKA